MNETHKVNETLNYKNEDIKWNLIIKEENGENVDRTLFSGPKKQIYRFLSTYAKNNKNIKMSGLLECDYEKELFRIGHGNVTYQLVK